MYSTAYANHPESLTSSRAIKGFSCLFLLGKYRDPVKGSTDGYFVAPCRCSDRRGP